MLATEAERRCPTIIAGVEELAASGIAQDLTQFREALGFRMLPEPSRHCILSASSSAASTSSGVSPPPDAVYAASPVRDPRERAVELEARFRRRPRTAELGRQPLRGQAVARCSKSDSYQGSFGRELTS